MSEFTEAHNSENEFLENLYNITLEDKNGETILCDTTLSDVGEGQKVKIKYVEGGHTFRQRIYDMGMYVDSEVEILNNPKYGPLILNVKGSKLAIGRGAAKKIYVEVNV